MKISAKNIVLSLISISFGIIFFCLVIMVLVWAGRTGYDFGHAIFVEEAVSDGLGRDVIVDVTADMTDKDVAKYIKEKGLVEDEKVFLVQIFLSDYKNKYVAGKYKLNTNMKPTEILKTLCSGDFYVDPASKIPEEDATDAPQGDAQQ